MFSYFVHDKNKSNTQVSLLEKVVRLEGVSKRRRRRRNPLLLPCLLLPCLLLPGTLRDVGETRRRVNGRRNFRTQYRRDWERVEFEIGDFQGITETRKTPMFPPLLAVTDTFCDVYFEVI